MASKKDRSKDIGNTSPMKPILAVGKSDANRVAPDSIAASARTDGKTPATTASAPVAVASAVSAPVATAAAPTTRDRSGIDQLIAKLRHPEADVARDAAAVLGKLPVDGPAVDALCAVLRNSDNYFHPVVRAAAAAALGALGDRRAVDALIHATGDSMAEASEEAINALALLGDPRALPALDAIIRNQNGFFLEPVRRRAGEAAARIRSKAAKP